MGTSLRYTVTVGVTLAAAFVSGCARVNPKPDYERAGKAISDATGSEDWFEPGQGDAVQRKVSALLADGITSDEAVRIALVNNPTLAAAFSEIGFARADLVQSGLFSNPTLAMSIAFPDGGGLSNIQATFAQNIGDLWQIPVRKKAAERSLDAAILNVAQQAVQLTNVTKTSYFTAVAADETLRIAEENRDLAAQLLKVAEARQLTGAVGELDVNLAKGTAFVADLDLQRARLESRSSRRQLGIALGLTDPVEQLSPTTPLAVDSASLPRAECIEEIALADRLDIRAAREVVEGSQARMRLEYLKVFPDLSIGFYNERNESRSLPGRRIPADTARASVAAGQLTAPEIQSRGQRQQERSQEITNIFGPAFNLTLPIFDQNQAQIAKAKLLYEQSAVELDVLERAARQRIREALDQVETTRNMSRYFRDTLLPQARSNLELSRKSYEVGRASVIVLLDAQRMLLSTRRDPIAAELGHSIAIAELERVASRPYATLVAAASETPSAATSHRLAPKALSLKRSLREKRNETN